MNGTVLTEAFIPEFIQQLHSPIEWKEVEMKRICRRFCLSKCWWIFKIFLEKYLNKCFGGWLRKMEIARESGAFGDKCI